MKRKINRRTNKKTKIKINQKIKQALSDEVPKPDHRRKDRFLRMYRRKYGGGGIGTLDLLRSQLAYIGMPVWFVSLMALVVAIWGIHANKEVIVAVSAIMPFVSGVAVFESFRSRMYGMMEMEGVTLVSMRGMLFARFVCVGLAHSILLSVLSVLLGANSGYGYGMTGAMVTVPYLLSSVGSMELERTPFGRKNIFGCIMVSVFISILMIFLQNERFDFTEKYRWLWYFAEAVLVIMEFMELKKTVQWEEYAWN